MKKVAIYFAILMLTITIIWSPKVYATEGEVIEENIEEELSNATSSVQAKAIVIEVGEVKELYTDYEISKTQEVKVEILEGKYETKEFTVDYLISYYADEKNNGYLLEVGDELQVQIVEDESGNVTVTIQDIIRNANLISIFAVFLIAVVLVSGKQAIKIIISLGVMILTLYFILIKGILAGYSVILMTLLAATVILGFHSLLTVGWNKKILVVFLATFISVMVGGIIASTFSHLTKISGTREDTILLGLNMTNIPFNFKDLIFTGMVISSLGICMNMAITLVSKLDEVKSKTEDMSWKELFKIGRNIGGKLLGTMIHTFVLVCIGSGLIILFMFLACNVGMKEIFNKETIAENTIFGIAGSIGIVLTMPMTALLYAILNYKKTNYKTISDNKLDGNRSLKL